MHSILFFYEVSDKIWLVRVLFLRENNTNPGARYCLGTRVIPEIIADL